SWLTFEVNEEDGIQYPVLISDWSNTSWVAGHDPRTTMARYAEYGQVGLISAPFIFNKTDQQSWTTKNVSGYNVNRTVDGNKLTYSYSLNEYRGTNVETDKNHVVHSSLTCVARTFWNGTLYRDGRDVGKLDDKDLSQDAPEYMHILKGLWSYYGATIDYLLVGGLVEDDFGKGSSGCQTTCKWPSLTLSLI
ncbi:hypothetical protein QBC38DRAFT_462530, partial [Podospora fimiseda]